MLYFYTYIWKFDNTVWLYQPKDTFEILQLLRVPVLEIVLLKPVKNNLTRVHISKIHEWMSPRPPVFYKIRSLQTPIAFIVYWHSSARGVKIYL